MNIKRVFGTTFVNHFSHFLKKFHHENKLEAPIHSLVLQQVSVVKLSSCTAFWNI